MKKYECPCGYVYDPEVGDPEGGIAPGTAFEDIPEDWVCPICGLGKDSFSEVEYPPVPIRTADGNVRLFCENGAAHGKTGTGETLLYVFAPLRGWEPVLWMDQ